jgi:hypothetical protein
MGRLLDGRRSVHLFLSDRILLTYW